MAGAPDNRFGSKYYVEGHATTFEPYLYFEIDGVKYYECIDRHALDGADMSDVIMQFDHSGRVFARQSNGSLALETDNIGLLVCADLSRSDSAKSLYGDIKAELINKMSWSFTVSEAKYNSDTHTRTILKIKKVYDVSAVSIPANADTDIAARSWIDGVIEGEKRETLARRTRILKLLTKTGVR